MAARFEVSFLRSFHSWWKQEQRQLPALASTHRLAVLAVALAVLLGGLELRRRWAEELQRSDQRLTQATEVLQAGLHTLKGTIYDWAHWDETDAFARGEAPQYFQRNLQISTGLMALVPVVAVFDRQGQPLGVRGRSGPYSWAADPLLGCAREQVPISLRRSEALLLLCADAHQRWWMVAMEGITDSTETSPVSGVILLAAPLQQPHFGGELQAAMADLEAQLQVRPSAVGVADRPLQTPMGEPLRGPAGTLAFVQPRPLAPWVVLSLLADLPLLIVFVMVLGAVRARLVLQRRHQELVEARRQQGLRRRLRQARRQLDRLCPAPHGLEGSGSTDLIDGLTRRLELYERTIGWLSLRDRASGLPNRSAWLEQLLFMGRQAQPFKVWLLLWPAGSELAAADLRACLERSMGLIPAALYSARISADRFGWLGPTAADAALLAQALQSLDGPWLLLECAWTGAALDAERWLQSQERSLLGWFAQGQRGWQPQLEGQPSGVASASSLAADWALALQLDQVNAGALLIRDGRQQVRGLALIPIWPGAPLPGLDPPRLQRLAAEQGRSGALMLRLLSQGLQAWRSLAPSRRQVLSLTLPLELQALKDPTLLTQIQAALQASGCPAALLSLICQDADLQRCLRADPHALAPLQPLRDQGVALLMAESGAEPVSFQHQTELGLDGVLVTPALTGVMPFDPAAASLVEALIRFAISCGQRVVVEEMRSIEQRDRLLALGVDNFQEPFDLAADYTLARALEVC